MNHRHLTALALLTLTLIPVGQADDFETTFFPDVPVGLTMTTGNAAITTEQAHSGTQSLKLTGTYEAKWYVGGDQCEIDAWLRLQNAPSGGTIQIRVQGTGGDNAISTVAGSGSSTLTNIGASPSSATGTAVGGLSNTAWIKFGIRACYTNQAIFFFDDGLGSQNSVTVTYANWATHEELNYVLITGAQSLYVDDTTWTGIPGPFADPNPGIWCSSPAQEDFGYDFLEGVTRDTTQVGITIDPFYKFQGQSDNYDYLGKSFDGTTNATSFFRIESAEDGFASVFRSVFTTNAATGTEDNPIMDKGTGITAGDTSGDFDEHVEAYFLESANDWNVKIRSYSALAGETVIQDRSASFSLDDPNSPNTYAFQWDTAIDTARVYKVNTAEVDGDFTVVMDADLILEVVLSDVGASNFVGDSIREHWFVGAGDNSLQDSDTALDENRNQELSTCITSPTSLDFNGNAGGLPTTIGQDDEGPTAGVGGVLLGGTGILPDGFTVAAYNGLLGILLMAAVGGGLYAAFKTPIAAAAGAVIGFIAAYFLGLFGLWIIVVAVVIAVAIIFVKTKGAVSSGA